MLTQCSHCKKTYNLSIAELQSCSTELFCPHCEEMLGRLKLFKSDFFFKSEKNASSYWFLWTLGFFLCLLLFMAQVYVYAHNQLAQNPQQRIWIEKNCRIQLCKLPVYKNLDEFEILHGDFQLKDNHHYVFQTVLSNQAEFKQNYPRIKLDLLDFSGQVFAERVFYPREYLGFEPSQPMPASETIEVSLDIAAPTQKVGGYTFELI